jgi:hypothetical protein
MVYKRIEERINKIAEEEPSSDVIVRLYTGCQERCARLLLI